MLPERRCWKGVTSADEVPAAASWNTIQGAGAGGKDGAGAEARGEKAAAAGALAEGPWTVKGSGLQAEVLEEAEDWEAGGDCETAGSLESSSSLSE